MKDGQTSAGAARFDDLLALALQGAEARWPAEPLIDHDEELLRLRFHGVAYALSRQLELLVAWPAPLVEAIRSEARLQALWETSHRAAVAQAIEALAEAGIGSALNKGSALAYLAYPDPAMRQRGDSDLIISAAQTAAAREVLRSTGWQPDSGSATQENWSFDTRAGFVHVIDLHWQANASAALRRVFDPAAALADAVPLPAFSPAARALSPSLLLLTGALNQAMHRTAGYLVGDTEVHAAERLIWTMDCHLLAQGFSHAQWLDLGEQAVARGMPRLCLATLERARDRFGTQVPQSLVERLGEFAGEAPIDAYIFDLSSVERFRAGWRGAESWRDRLRLLGRNLFMAPGPLRRKYPGMARYPLPILHGRRLLEGTIRAIRPAPQQEPAEPR